ncbi:MAG TPA: nodulation protein NfeD [Vicinamibacterales bacterium]|jgi:membrane-bound serine protease (ClpP class)|nr:nodulation protein NfeD [Vicinamibacterales bacterium]
MNRQRPRLSPRWARLGPLTLFVWAVCVAAAGPGRAPVVYSAVVDSVIHPASAEYMIETMDRADRDQAALVVFTLRTPGGLVDSTRQIITHMLAAKTPVAIWVGPSGTRAASAGFILTIAADIAAMAPGTNIGAAHPVNGSGPAVDETMAKKMAEDVAAYVRSLAGGRHRNVQLAEQAVNQSKAFTEQEALSASPPLIDVIASDIPDLLKKLDGRTVTRFDGSSVTLHTASASIVPIEMSLRQKVLSAIAHPNVAYLLLSLGTLGLTIELWSPGAVLPGVAGGLCLLLAFFALQVLPVNYAGLLLMLFGLTLFALEVKVTSFGLLTAGGVVSLIFGSMMLFDSTSPELQLSLSVVVPVVLGFTAIAAFLVRLGLAAQRRPAVTGMEGMINETGEAIAPIGPGAAGRARIHGESWSAVSNEPIAAGERVRVASIDGLTLTVRKD